MFPAVHRVCICVQWYENRECKFQLVQKFLGKLFSTELPFSPYNVVA